VAAYHGHISSLEFWLERKSETQHSKDGSSQKKPKKTIETPSISRLASSLCALLSWAVAGNHEAVVRLLVQREDVEVDEKYKDARTPLLWAERVGTRL
jgi:hypothetical protein